MIDSILTRTTPAATCACDDREAVNRLADAYLGKEGVLVDLLHDTQSHFGYLPDPILRHLADRLDLPIARIYGVATFYSSFRFTPPPQNEIKVCTGTACHVRGAPNVLQEFEDLLDIRAEETSDDGWVGLRTVSCVGCCALAPAVVVNGAVQRATSPSKMLRALTPRQQAEEGDGDVA